MIRRTLRSPRPLAILAGGLLLTSSVGCHGLGRKHEEKSIPEYGMVDPSQPGELRKVTQAPYVIEPPDELEITTKPSFPSPGSSTFTVQPDGFVDLGLSGDVYVCGLTLAEAEERIALQLNDAARARNPRTAEKYRVSVRLANGQSKFYYVIGIVQNPGRFKVAGNDTVAVALATATSGCLAIVMPLPVHHCAVADG